MDGGRGAAHLWPGSGRRKGSRLQECTSPRSHPSRGSYQLHTQSLPPCTHNSHTGSSGLSPPPLQESLPRPSGNLREGSPPSREGPWGGFNSLPCLLIHVFMHMFSVASCDERRSALYPPQLYVGQHWPSSWKAWHCGFTGHFTVTQANPGGRHWHSSQGSAVGRLWPSVYSIPSTTHTSKKTGPSLSWDTKLFKQHKPVMTR